MNDCNLCAHSVTLGVFKCTKGLARTTEKSSKLKSSYRYFSPSESNTPGYKSNCKEYFKKVKHGKTNQDCGKAISI